MAGFPARRAWLEKHRDFVLLLVLFVTFRIMSALLLSPGGHFYRHFSDREAYRNVGELALRGFYPFVHYWLEYPPVFAYLNIAIYRLSILLPLLPPEFDPLFWFDGIRTLIFLAFESGNLVLVYLLGQRLHGPAGALRCGWIYALLFLPAYILQGWYDNFPLFFLLLGLYLLVQGRGGYAGLAIGLGFMIKPFPAILLGPALRALSGRKRIACFVGAAVGALAVALPFLGRPQFLLAYFTGALARSSWETHWAVLEGYFGVGGVAPLATHTDPATAALQVHPATLPWLWITAAFAVLYLFLLRQRYAWPEPRVVVAFAGLTMNLFFLQSKGYSPQFVVYLLPFIALLLPHWRGVAYTLVLTVLNFAELPLYVEVFPTQEWLLAVVVWARAATLVALSLEYLALLQPSLGRYLAPVGRIALLPAAGAVVVALVWGGATLGKELGYVGPYPAAAAYIRSLAAGDEGLLLPDRRLFYSLHPLLRTVPAWFPTIGWEEPGDGGVANLEAFAAGHRQLWLVTLEGWPPPWQPFLEKWLAERGSVAGEKQFGGVRVRSYVVSTAPAAPSQPRPASFGDGLELQGFDLARYEIAPGGTLRLRLYWQARERMAEDYQAAVRVVGPTGQSGGECSRPLLRGSRPTSAWQPGETAVWGCDLTVAAGAAPGPYRLEAGVSRPHDRGRLPVRGEAAAREDRLLIGNLEVVPPPPAPVGQGVGAGARFENQVDLTGYQTAGTARPGGALTVDLIWQAVSLPAADYTVFNHLVDGEGRIVAQQDGPPQAGRAPTGQWVPGRVVRDQHTIQIPPAVPPGTYRLEVGLYEATTGRRLPVLDERGEKQADRAFLQSVRVVGD